jgi:hypothetical protein
MKQNFIKRVLYKLRQSYGMSLTYTRLGSPVVNLETGVQSQTETEYTIKKAIRLPRKLFRTNELGNIFPDFRYGGTYDKQTRKIVLEAAMLPAAFIPNIDIDVVTISSQRWVVKEVHEIDYQLGYVILVEALEGAET